MRRHLVVFAALVVNLWVGGALIEQLAGLFVRGGFEMLLIFGYLHFMWGFPGKLRRSPEDDEDAERRRP